MVFAHHVQVPGNPAATLGLDAGVLIFFALSGYLLYAPFAAARDAGESIDLWVYGIRRAARLLPAFYVASVLISAIWYPWLLTDPVGLLLGTRTPIVVVWTLQLEVGFYVLLPFLAWGLARVARAHRIRALLVLASASVAFTIAVMASSIATTGVVRSTDLLSLGSFLWAFAAGMIVVELRAAGRPGTAAGSVGHAGWDRLGRPVGRPRSPAVPGPCRGCRLRAADWRPSSAGGGRWHGSRARRWLSARSPTRSTSGTSRSSTPWTARFRRGAVPGLPCSSRSRSRPPSMSSAKVRRSASAIAWCWREGGCPADACSGSHQARCDPSSSRLRPTNASIGARVSGKSSNEYVSGTLLFRSTVR